MIGGQCLNPYLEIEAQNPAVVNCRLGEECDPGKGCIPLTSPSPTPSSSPYNFNPCSAGWTSSGNCDKVLTGLGITFETSAQGIGKGLLGLLITIGGAIAFILIIITGYRLMTSQGDPEKIKAAREQLTSAIVGLIFIIFSIAILSFLGVDVLGIFEK
jgi:hypothetical protein